MRPLLVCALMFITTYGALAQSNPTDVKVWIYRPASDNSGLPLTLHMDGRKLANLGHGQFFGIQVSPGPHTFNWTTQPSARQVVIPIESDSQPYLEVTFRTSQPFLIIEAITAEKATTELNGLRPINQNSAFDPRLIIPAQAIEPPAVKVAISETTTDRELRPAIVSPQPSLVAEAPKPAPPQVDAPRVQRKTEKHTIWVTAITHDPNSGAASDETNGAGRASCASIKGANALTNSKVNCDTNDPSRNHNRNMWRLDVVNKVEADSGQIYTISCTANWFGSNCASLVDGDKFNAEVDNDTMWIAAQQDGKRKALRIKYRILDIQDIP